MGLFNWLFGPGGPDIRKLLEEKQYDEIKKLASTDKGIVPKLIQQLNSKHIHMRERAANLLGEMNESRALPALVRVVKRGIDANRPITLQYAYDVHQYRDVDRYIDTKGFERRIPLFDWVFQDHKGSDKMDVVAARKALKRIMYASDFKPLFVALKDKNAEVREKAAEVLMRRSPAIHQPYIESAIKELITVSEQDGNAVVRRNARLALRNMGLQALEPLIAALKDKNPRKRHHIAWTLYWLWDTHKDDRAIEPLIAAFDEKDVAVVAGAYYYFLEQGEDGTETILIKALNGYGHLSKEMVEDFLNCGNNQLENAARQWAYTHGFNVRSSAFGGRRGWGSKRSVYRKRDTKG